MTNTTQHDAYDLLKELSGPAATVIQTGLDESRCGICENSITFDVNGRERGHVSDCLVLRARKLLRGRQEGSGQ